MPVENVCVISIVAGLCTCLGAILLFFKRNWSDHGLAFFLGLASGVMVAVVLFDMLPSALLYASRGLACLGIGIGLIGLAIFDHIIMRRVSAKESLFALGYLVMLGIALHDLPEGMAIALGNEMKARTGMVIAMGIAIHNIPEGMAIAAPLLMGGMRRLKIFGQTFMVGLITPLGTLLGCIVAASVPRFMPLLLGFASGVMIYLVFFQLWPQARGRGARSRWWGFWAGIFFITLATFV